MTKNALSNLIAIISTIGFLCWITTNFYGGMILYLFSYGLVIVPIVLAYFGSLIEVTISTIKRGVAQNKIKLLFHGIFILVVISIYLFQSELFKSKQILTATLKDDLFHYELIFRENGDCENNIIGFLGFEETFHGKYKFNGDTIIFKKKPYDNDFLPDTLLIDKNQNVIFKERDIKGNFSNKKQWLNHFEINSGNH